MPEVNLVDLCAHTEAIVHATYVEIEQHITAVADLLLFVADFKVGNPVHQTSAVVVVVFLYIAPVALGVHVKGITAQRSDVVDAPVHMQPGPGVLVLNHRIRHVIVIAADTAWNIPVHKWRTKIG